MAARKKSNKNTSSNPKPKPKVTAVEVNAAKKQELFDEIVGFLQTKHDISNIGETQLAEVKQYIPTGADNLDAVLNGGIPCGRIIEIFGENGTGKSTFAEQLMSGNNAIGGFNVLMLSEPVMDKDRMYRIGVKKNRTVIQYPETIEEGFVTIARYYGQRMSKPELASTPTLIVWDSLSASPSELESKAALETDSAKAKKIANKEGLGPMKRAQFIRSRLSSFAIPLSRANITLVLVSQVQHGPNSATYGVTTSRAGGGPAFYSTLRFKTKRLGYYSLEDVELGIYSIISLVKSKAPGVRPRSEIPVALNYHNGYDNDESVRNFLNDYYNTPCWTAAAWQKLIDQDGVEHSYYWKDMQEKLDSIPGVRKYLRDWCFKVIKENYKKREKKDK